MKLLTKALLSLSAGLFAASAWAVPVTLSQLSGETGGSPAATAVFKANLSTLGLTTIRSISIRDNSSGLGGSFGQFSGFDLDAIKLSTTNCTTAACAAGLAGLAVFDFGAGTTFTPGSQRAPLDPKLFGTGPAGNTVNNSVATLGAFDGNSTTAIPGAFGFISMGDNGILLFNLTSAVSTAGLWLYIGEVGNNGEAAASNVQVNSSRVPEPATLALLGLGLAVMAAGRRRRS